MHLGPALLAALLFQCVSCAVFVRMRSDSMTPNPPATPIRVDKGRCKSILRFSRPNLIVSQHTRRFNWLESQLSLVLSPAPMSLTGRHKYQSRLHVERSVS